MKNISKRKCAGICFKFKAKKPGNKGRYESGQVRCQICETYLTLKGTKNNEGIYCRCCNYRVRGKPRNKTFKEKLRLSTLKENRKNEDGHHKNNDGDNAKMLIELCNESNEKIIESTIVMLLHNFQIRKRLWDESDKIGKFSELYIKYGTIAKIAEIERLPPHEVRKYVLFDRLTPSLKKAYDNNELASNPALALFIALEACDAYEWDGEKSLEWQILQLAQKISRHIIQLKKSGRILIPS